MKICTSVITRLFDKLGLRLVIVYEYLPSFINSCTKREIYSIQTLEWKMTRVCNFRYMNPCTYFKQLLRMNAKSPCFLRLKNLKGSTMLALNF